METTDGNGHSFQGMGENSRAVYLEIPISTIRERLTGTLADWGTDFSAFLKELEEKRALLQEIETEVASKSHEVAAVHRRVQVQETQIETLKIKAEEAATLRKEIHDKDLALGKKNSEVDNKHRLIGALQRDLKRIGQLKGTISAKDREIARLAKEKQRAQQRAAKLTEEFKRLTAELEAVRAELNARKTLETQLEEKRNIISKLEASINRHVSTFAKSQHSVSIWKEKYATLKSRNPSSESTIAPKLTEKKLQAQERAEGASENRTTATTPHNMRKSLLEALRNDRAQKDGTPHE